MIFITILFFMQSLYYLYQDQRMRAPKKVSRRLRAVLETGGGEGEAITPLIKSRLMSEIPGLNRILSRIRPMKKLQELLDRADLDWTSGRFLLTVLFLAQMTWIAADFFIERALIPKALALVAGALPFLMIYRKIRLREKAFERQLPDLLDLMGRSIRAGHSLSGAIRFAGEESPEPAGVEFARVFDEINFGVDMATALQNLARRVNCADLRYLIAAIMIQMETGGNLTELLDRLAHLIRERFKLIGQTRALTAQSRFSGYILSGIPIAMAGILYLIQPEYLLTLLKDPTGIKVVCIALGLQVIGFWVIRHMVNMEAL